jgi:hypothetical protein
MILITDVFAVITTDTFAVITNSRRLYFVRQELQCGEECPHHVTPISLRLEQVQVMYVTDEN